MRKPKVGYDSLPIVSTHSRGKISSFARLGVYLNTSAPSEPARIRLKRVAWSILECAHPTYSLEGRLDGLPLRASNEGLLRPRVARA